MSEGTSLRWAPAAELGLQVMPLVFKLADSLRQTDSSTRATEFRAVEGEAATMGLGVNMEKIGVDERNRIRPRLKTSKLGMMAVAASATEKNLTSKEGFSPERCEALGIEIARMHGPKSQRAPLWRPTIPHVQWLATSFPDAPQSFRARGTYRGRRRMNADVRCM